jgi:hypothetical protein
MLPLAVPETIFLPLRLVHGSGTRREATQKKGKAKGWDASLLFVRGNPCDKKINDP